MDIQNNKYFLGRYIVVDPEICHGEPTFIGIRIMVKNVLNQVAKGLNWQYIVESWRNSISIDAIKEAVTLSNKTFLEHIDELYINK